MDDHFPVAAVYRRLLSPLRIASLDADGRLDAAAQLYL